MLALKLLNDGCAEHDEASVKEMGVAEQQMYTACCYRRGDKSRANESHRREYNMARTESSGKPALTTPGTAS